MRSAPDLTCKAQTAYKNKKQNKTNKQKVTETTTYQTLNNHVTLTSHSKNYTNTVIVML